MDEAQTDTDLITLTVDVVSAFVANNSLKGEELARLITETHAALAGLGKAPAAAAAEPEFKAAVSVRKSLASRDHIISMIDGKPYRSLTRHLTRHGLTAVQYRQRYGLSKDYPVVAPAYSEARRAMALKIGLGQKGRAARGKAAAARAKAPAKAAAKAPAKRGPRVKG